MGFASWSQLTHHESEAAQVRGGLRFPDEVIALGGQYCRAPSVLRRGQTSPRTYYTGSSQAEALALTDTSTFCVSSFYLVIQRPRRGEHVQYEDIRLRVGLLTVFSLSSRRKDLIE